MNKGTIKKISLSFLSSLLLILIVPFSYINAESQATYYSYNQNTCFLGYTYPITNGIYYQSVFNSNVEGRIVGFHYGNNYAMWFVTLENGYYSLINNQLNTYSCSLPNTSLFEDSYNGTTYYYINVMNPKTQSNNTFNENIVFIETDVNHRSSDDAFRYAYGDLSVDPAPSVDYGGINGLSFYTNYISKDNTSYLTTMPYNQDVIQWDTSTSNNNTPLNDSYSIEIHAERFKYVSPTISDLMVKTLQDMSILPNSDVSLGTYSILNGRKEFQWSEVAYAFLGSSDAYKLYESLFPALDNVENVYSMYGWYYKVRLVNESDNYTGSWQIVYNNTTLPSTSEPILENYYTSYNYEYDYQINNSITTINNLNNTTNNTTNNNTYNNVYSINSEPININFGDATYNVDILSDNIIGSYNQMHDIEINVFNQLDENLEELELLDFDNDIDSDFVSTSNWVNTQFNTMLTDNPIGTFLKVVVGIGIIFLIVGIIV